MTNRRYMALVTVSGLGNIDRSGTEDSSMTKPQAPLILATLSLLAVTPAAMAAPGWSTLESKSPEDASSQIGGALVVGDAALILRCRGQNAEAADSTKDTYLGDDMLTIRESIPTGRASKYGVHRRIALQPLRQSR
jgi:hypothetical protein